MISAALRSPGFNFRNRARGSLDVPLEPAGLFFFFFYRCRCAGPQMKTKAFAKRPMAAPSIVVSSIQDLPRSIVAAFEMSNRQKNRATGKPDAGF